MFARLNLCWRPRRSRAKTREESREVSRAKTREESREVSRARTREESREVSRDFAAVSHSRE